MNAIDDLFCEYYDPVECNSTMTTTTCDLTKRCVARLNQRVHCYAFWRNDNAATTGGDATTLLKKGCWLDSDLCHDRLSCIADRDEEFNFCCCDGSMCNANFSGSGDRTALSANYDRTSQFVLFPTRTSASGPTTSSGLTVQPTTVVLIAVLFSVVALSLIAMLLLWIKLKKRYIDFIKGKFTAETGDVEVQLISSPSPAVLTCSPTTTLPSRPPLPEIQLLEVKSQGQFGCVWTGKMSDRVVAVKVFPARHRSSWKDESAIYRSLCCSSHHDNVLRFIGAKEVLRGNEEYWLVTDYHEFGSLHDYLERSTLTRRQVLTATSTLCDGLEFLHSTTTSNGLRTKPPIVHRDLKSRNVLLNAVDLSAVISDFGLALDLDVADVSGLKSVGTLRYQSPELLEGSIVSQKEELFKIDIYAFSLVLWELLTRCSDVDGPVHPYRLPFQEEVGSHPSVDDMINLVSVNKRRPAIKEYWRHDEGFGQLCLWMEECWDEDPDARPTAGCLRNRLVDLQESDSSTPSSMKR